MNAHVHRHPDHAFSVIEIDQTARRQIGQLGIEAQHCFLKRVTAFWAKPDGPELVAPLLVGAVILRKIGRQAEACVLLNDHGAHLAFEACRTLAMAAKCLKPEFRTVLEETLTLLAMCCPLTATVPELPPVDVLPERYRTDDNARELYRVFTDRSKEPEVTQYTALILLRLFQCSGRAEDTPVVTELLEVTSGLRSAFKRLHEATNP